MLTYCGIILPGKRKIKKELYVKIGKTKKKKRNYGHTGMYR